MEFAYLDESGDPGARGSKNLILVLMCTPKKQDLIRIVREAKQRLLENNKSAKFLSRNGGEIKFHGFPDAALLVRTLKKISQLDIKVYVLVIRKEQKSIPPTQKSIILGDLFRHIIEVANNKKPQRIIADIDFMNREKINKFYLKSYKVFPSTFKIPEISEEIAQFELAFGKIETDEEYQQLKKDPSNHVIEIEHLNSKQVEELQALDLICGSIFKDVEFNDDQYTKILESGKLTITGSTAVMTAMSQRNAQK